MELEFLVEVLEPEVEVRRSSGSMAALVVLGVVLVVLGVQEIQQVPLVQVQVKGVVKKVWAPFHQSPCHWLHQVRSDPQT